MGASSDKEIPCSGLFNNDEEKEKIFINSIGKINFKELIMESLTPEFLKLFEENINLFYSQSFIEGISYEYGLFNKSKNAKKAFNIYKDAADLKYDYLCMYRMHKIYLIDYENFGVKKNRELYRLYLYKCFAYLPYLIINRTYNLLNKIDVINELEILLNEDNNSMNFDRFMDFLENNKKDFNATTNDIELMKNTINLFFFTELNEQDIGVLDCLRGFGKQKGENAYFEAKLKYCNFYLELSENCDKEEIKNIFDDLIKAGYYKACCDYGRFLLKENKIDDAKIIFKKGSEHCEQFCFSEYSSLLFSSTNFNLLLADYSMISYILKNICIYICIDKLGQSSFYYMIYYLIKHSSFKQKIQNDFIKYTKEIFQNNEKYFQIENNELIYNTFSEKYIIDQTGSFGQLFYYGIGDIIKSDKEKSLIYCKKAYKLAKEREYGFFKRINYLIVYKCRKYLYKINKISLRKINKTKEKLFRLYEECNMDDLNIFELYNYYKLYKIGVYGNTYNKLISILKKGKNINTIYHFRDYVYREKCKIALEREYSNNSSLNQNKIILKNESFNENGINLYFKTMENKQYNLRVSKDIQFIIAIHKLYTKYPELESKKIATYVSNGNKICIYNTIEENELKEGNIIVIINKFD